MIGLPSEWVQTSFSGDVCNFFASRCHQTKRIFIIGPIASLPP